MMAQAGANDATDKARTFVLQNVPEIEDKDEYLTDFLESLLPKTVETLSFHPNLPDTALVTMTESIDVRHAESVIARNTFDDQTLTLEVAKPGNIVILDGSDPQELILTYVRHYFQREFAEGNEIVSGCVQIPHSKMHAFSFTNTEVMERVLMCGRHNVPFQRDSYEVQVEPFYLNFHGPNPFERQPLNTVLEEAVAQNTSTQENQKPKRPNLNKQNSVCISSNSEKLCISSPGLETDHVRQNPRRFFNLNEDHFAPQRVNQTAHEQRTIVTESMEFSTLYYNYLACHHKTKLEKVLTVVEMSVNVGRERTDITLSGSERAVKEAIIIMHRIHRQIKGELQWAQSLLKPDTSQPALNGVN